jgi:hypothetical protein
MESKSVFINITSGKVLQAVLHNGLRHRPRLVPGAERRGKGIAAAAALATNLRQSLGDRPSQLHSRA